MGGFDLSLPGVAALRPRGPGGGGGASVVALAGVIAGFGAASLAALTVGSAPAEQAETTALVTRFTTPPTTARRAAIDTLVKALKDGGLWTRFDVFYVLAAADDQAARLNWIGATPASMSKVNMVSGDFLADGGYTGGSTKYLDTNFNPTTAGGRYGLNSAQLEDYDWVTAGNAGASARGAAAMQARLGHPAAAQHYLSGFVLRPDQAGSWPAIDRAAAAGVSRGVAETFLWALPQVLRDGFVHFGEGAAMQAFDDVSFPLAMGRQASVIPTFSTAVVATGAGAEQRNADWADTRMRFDVGPGARSEADCQALIAFFRARRGAARGFRLRDPYDDSSAGMTATPGPTDQRIGTGDGVVTGFALRKFYDGQERRITRPAAGSVRVAVAGVERTAGWTMEPGGVVRFAVAPAAGAAITAGYRFDVPVRFAEDRLEVSRASFLAGEAPSVELVEIREGAA